MEIRSKVALVTGALSEIGAATAKILATQGVRPGLAARITKELGKIEREIISEWYLMVDVNLKGVLNATAAVFPFMIKQHSGHIVNLSFYTGKNLAKDLSLYSATKFAPTI